MFDKLSRMKTRKYSGRSVEVCHDRESWQEKRKTRVKMDRQC